jgi:L-alanine-DL-glutamate epimerase-like enolase superfamily enzyme
LKITRIDAIPVPAPMTGLAPGGAHRSALNLTSTIVQVHTDDGLIGYGESWLVYEDESPLVSMIENGMAPLIIGAEVGDIEQIWQRLFWNVKRSHGMTRALSAIDQALWDLKAKKAGMPLYELLGGRANDGIIAYATTPQIDRRYGESIARLMPHGFRAAKMAAGRGVAEDVALAESARDDTRGLMDFAVDANGRYDFPTALRLCREFERIGVMWFEEPLPHHDIQGLAELGRRTDVPIAGFQEESTHWRARDYLAADALSIYNLSLATCGGVTVARKVSALCDAFHRRLNPHGFGPPIMYAATLHVAYASPSTTHIEFPVLDPGALDPRTPSWSVLVANTESFSVSADGTIAPPSQPGLGIELDQALLAELIESKHRNRLAGGPNA